MDNFRNYHRHEAARLLEIFDNDGEAAMLAAAAAAGRPLDECSYIFPDRSVVENHVPQQYRFHSYDDLNAVSVTRPATRGISISDPFPESHDLPEVAHRDSLAAYGLTELYRRFSEDAYCASWMGSPEEDPNLRQEFTDWLIRHFERNRHIGPATPYRYEHHEEAALASLHQVWQNAVDRIRS